MNLSEQMAAAERCWDVAHRQWRETRHGEISAENRDTLYASIRANAVKIAPLYPVVEARRGPPF